MTHKITVRVFLDMQEYSHWVPWQTRAPPGRSWTHNNTVKRFLETKSSARGFLDTQEYRLFGTQEYRAGGFGTNRSTLRGFIGTSEYSQG